MADMHDVSDTELTPHLDMLCPEDEHRFNDLGNCVRCQNNVLKLRGWFDHDVSLE